MYSNSEIYFVIVLYMRVQNMLNVIQSKKRSGQLELQASRPKT